MEADHLQCSRNLRPEKGGRVAALRVCRLKARRSSASAIAAEVFMKNAG
jgi:hypothetical protein